MDLPCSRQSLWLHAGGTNPGSASGRSLNRDLRFRLPLNAIGSAAPITVDFGAIFPFTAVPAYNLPVYASQRPVAGRHARLGTRLRAKLYRGRHPRRLSLTRLQGATHLNPIERLWGVMHRNVTHNKTYATCAQFADATLHFLREKVPRRWADLRDSVTDNFRVISPKDFRVVA